MVLDQTIIGGIFLILMFLLYNYLIFEFADKILENPKLKKGYRIPVGIINTVLAFGLTVLDASNSLLGYLCVFVIFSIEFHLFYKDASKRIFFVVYAYLIHFIALRAASIGIFAWLLDLSVYNVANQTLTLIYSMAATFLIANIAISTVIKLIPAKYIKIINQHVEQLNFVTNWLLIFIVYFMINSVVYSTDSPSPMLVLNQITAPIAILAGLYIMLFFAIKNGELLGYKEKNRELEMEIHKEQQYRDAITKETIANYEFNLTQNIMLSCTGIELERGESHNEQGFRVFSETMYALATKLILPEDQERFLLAANIDNLRLQFQIGNHEDIIEYRRIDKNGAIMWVRAATNLVLDDVTGDIKGFTYIKNIDVEKKKQIDLRNKAERDSLTSLYNKGTTGKKIAEYLFENPNSKNALLIVDIDNFKQVNDHFGHTFGDVVLCELSERLKSIFRSDDIIGRVGGDEFIVFVKNVNGERAVNTKATEICRAFQSSYKSNNLTHCQVSGSVGVALCPTHGQSFQDLYKNADVALYASKIKGKNCYTIYNGEEFVGYAANPTEIDNTSFLPQKSFKGNRIEYVFKILYGSANAVSAVNAVLEMLSNHFKFSRGYIFAADEAKKTISNTFEWCADKIEPQIKNLQDLAMTEIGAAMQSFEKTGMYIVENLRDIPQSEREILEPQGIKSMMQFAFFDGDRFAGLIGFDDCFEERVPTHEEIDEMATICNILETFMEKQHATEDAQNTAKSLATVLNNLNSYAYVIKKDTYEVIFQNSKAAESSADALTGNPCYKVYRNNNKPCDDCPIKKLRTAGGSQSGIIYNQKWGMWVDATVSNISWTDGEEVLLVNCVDITKYRGNDGAAQMQEEQPVC